MAFSNTGLLIWLENVKYYYEIVTKTEKLILKYRIKNC